MSNRRSFLSMLTAGSLFRQESTLAAMPVAGMQLHSKQGALSRAEALHLLRRLTFGATPSLLEQIEGKTADEAVDVLLGDGSTPTLPTPGGWINEQTENPAGADLQTRFAIEGMWRSQFRGLQSWWIQLMTAETLPATEKLTLFWSGHFTSEFDFDDIFNVPQLLYHQNRTLRADRLASFPKIVEDITLDGAMLVYLGGTLNVAGRPNENFARELLELYTTGLGGRYTEGDIQEAARVLTGWRAQRFNDEPAPNGMYVTYFSPARHDIGQKEFLGRTIPARDNDTNTEFLVRRDEVRRLIEIIFEERPDEVAEFIAAKIYNFFVYSNPTAAESPFVKEMARIFKEADFRLLPVFKFLFTSEHFYDAAFRGVQIKTPAEFAVGLVRQLQGNAPSNMAAALTSFEQSLMDPPTVAGWEGYRTWISTKTYPLRVRFGEELVASLSAEQLVRVAEAMPRPYESRGLTQDLTDYLLPVPIIEARLDYYEQVLLQGAPDYEWGEILTGDRQAAALRLRALLNAIVRSPDIHLC